MQNFVHILTELSAAAAGSLVAAIWEGLVLAAVVWVLLRALPGMTAAARSAVWLAAMVVVVLLPFVHLGGAVAGTDSARWHVDERVSVALVFVWVALSVFRAGQLVRSAVWLHGIARRAVPVESVAGKGQYGDSGSARMTTDHRRAQLCVSDEVDRPSVVGFFSPRILIPGSLLQKLAEGELEQIVLHEMEHLRRGDDWTNLLQKLSLMVFPLNPALVWIERRLCLERELACDDSVLRATNARKAYAACLANLAEHSLVRRGVSLALGAWERRPELVRRVHRILFRPEREMGRRQAGLAVAAMLLGLLGGADVLAHAPQVVSFGPAAPVALAANELRMPGLKAEDVVFHSPAVPPGLKPRVSPRRGGGTKVAPMQNAQTGFGVAKVRAVVAGRESSGSFDCISRKCATYAAQDDGLSGRGGMGTVTPSNDAQVVVLVTWRTVRTTVPDADGNAVPVTVQSSQFSYAAVPTRNGWLFVQL